MAKLCPKCKTRAPYESARFCPNCGTPLDAVKGKETLDTERVSTAIVAGSAEAAGPDKDISAGKPKKKPDSTSLGHKVIDRKVTDEIDFDVSKIPFRAAFDKEVDTTAKEFVRVPINPSKGDADEGNAAWRATLISAHPDHELLALEVYDEAIIGRPGSGFTPDVDMIPYGGGILGVSRRHAKLRPSPDGLQLLDLGSTNGTFCNGSRIGADEHCTLEEGFVISIAGVHFLVHSLAKV